MDDGIGIIVVRRAVHTIRLTRARQAHRAIILRRAAPGRATR